MKYKTKGFTLLELAIVITVLTILAVATMPQIAEDYNRTRTHLTIGEIESFSEAARLYAHNKKGVWPDAPGCAGAIEELKDEGYLQGVDEKSPWKTPYKTSCTDKIFTITTDVSKQHEDWAGVILNAVHSTDYDQIQRYVVHTNVVLPGGVPATRDLLHRNKIEGDPELNTMNTAIHMNKQDLLNVKDITLRGKIVDAIDPNFYLDPDGTSVMRHAELSTLKATGLRTKSGFAEGGTTNEFGYTARDANGPPEGDGQENRNPKKRAGSINVNDIWLRSADKWVSQIITPRHRLLSMWFVGNNETIPYPSEEDCASQKGEKPKIFAAHGGVFMDNTTDYTRSYIRIDETLATLKIYTQAAGWYIKTYAEPSGQGGGHTAVQVYCYNPLGG